MRIIRAADQEFVPASHEDPKNPGVLKRVIATKDEMLAGRCQMINWAKLPVGHSFRAHYHEDMEETFILIRGQASMRVGAEIVDLAAGDTVVVAPHEVHEMRNSGDEEVEYVVMGISLGLNGKTIVVS
ncbi:MAG: cupin domain-containing protein [Planctomycetales bacterium]|nr:cupin domain-containing protein [Planctomycetales bacterium]MCA9170571.1 cupin domain-containing protein [Planctomycetales bacterium]